MSQSQRELRRAAARAFAESLDQLGMRLNSPEDKVAERTAQSTQGRTNRQAVDVESDAQALEEAVADIEQFIQAQDSNDLDRQD